MPFCKQHVFVQDGQLNSLRTIELQLKQGKIPARVLLYTIYLCGGALLWYMNDIVSQADLSRQVTL